MTWIPCTRCGRVNCTCFSDLMRQQYRPPPLTQAPVFYPYPIPDARVADLERRIAELEKRATPKKRRKAKRGGK